MTKTMNVAMIGGGFMGKAHAMAYAAMPMFFWPAPAIPHRKVVVDVTQSMADEARARFGFDEASADWKAVIARDDIDVIDICTPNNAHAEIAIAAAAPFFYGVAEGEDIPGFTWALTSTGATSWRLTVTADPAELPSEVKAWTATTESGYRDFRNYGNASGVAPTWTPQDISGSGGVYTFDLDEPSGTRWTGVFMELAYSSDTAPSDYIFTTEVFVVPEAMPYADPNP